MLLNGDHCRGEAAECPVANPPLPGTDAPTGFQDYYLREGSVLRGAGRRHLTSPGAASIPRRSKSSSKAPPPTSVAVVLASCSAAHRRGDRRLRHAAPPTSTSGARPTGSPQPARYAGRQLAAQSGAIAPTATASTRRDRRRPPGPARRRDHVTRSPSAPAPCRSHRATARSPSTPKAEHL